MCSLNDYSIIKRKKNIIAVFVIFITKSLGIKILNNVAVTASFHDPSHVKIQLERTFFSYDS